MIKKSEECSFFFSKSREIKKTTIPDIHKGRIFIYPEEYDGRELNTSRFSIRELKEIWTKYLNLEEFELEELDNIKCFKEKLEFLNELMKKED
jgi:hypothetical protein